MRASIDLDARLRQAILDLLAEVVGNRLRVPAQRELRLVVRVVRVAGRHVAKGRFALHVHVVLVVVHFEDGLRRVDDLPDHDGRDLDRVAVQVVDLQPGALEVPHAQRRPPLRVERVCEAQPRLPRGADVLAEQLQDLGLVRIDDEQAAGEHDLHRERHERRR